MRIIWPISFFCLAILLARPVLANIPGGGTGAGPNVTITDNGDGTVTMANGTVSIIITKANATIYTINYTYNNGGGTQTQSLLSGGKDGGEFYWELGGFGSGNFSYSVVSNTPGYCEVDLFSDSVSNGAVDIHFSMLRGSPGFYVTPIFSHRTQDAAMGTGEERDNIYFAPYFNWMSVNDQVQRETTGDGASVPAFYSPQENYLLTGGLLQGTYEDKYKWSADFGVERVWGWSSVSDTNVGFTGKNIGIWYVDASAEFYNGGPLKPELNDAPMVHMINGGHYYFGNDSGFGNGEVWTRVSGPYFIYFNNVTNTFTDPVQTSQALWADAKAQSVAEAGAWPYSWFSNPNYASAAQRGTVTGRFVIADSGNTNASASNLWVGVVQQPVTTDGVYDFQLWMKPYQFWTRTDANGNFVISNVIAGNNYTLYAFGPGASGTFMSKNQSGGQPKLLYDLASPQFTVVVIGDTTNNLNTVTWTPSRTAPTVFEIGYPDRKGDKFRHGDDYWVGDIGPSPTSPSPVWTKFLEFPFDFPNGLNYVVGQNRWNTDWNFIQSVYPDFAGNNATTGSTVTFNLASAPANGATASLLLDIASDDASPLYVTVNGTFLSSGNATGTPTTSLPTTGWFTSNGISDSNIREENHGAFSDERLTFAGSLLHAGNNTINFSFRQAGGSSFSHHFIYDYLRLELTGYIPPTPAGVTVYAGNNCNLICWSATPGATGYNILRSLTSGSGYVPITNGVVGPVCGSGPQNATFVDTTAVNDTTYYYTVQSVNPAGVSTNSPPSSGVTPSAGISANIPSAPVVTVAGTSNAVTLNWSAVPGANFYTIQRGTVVNKLGYVVYYSTLDNATTGTSFTDASGTLGCTYSYLVTATSAGGTSSNSISVVARPVPPPPANPPAGVKIVATVTSNSQSAFISWSPVSGAVGYILYRANTTNGPFAFPANYIMSMMTTNWTDGGLDSTLLYSYTVVAMNAGGISSNSAVVTTPPPAPVTLGVTAGNTQILLNWSASPGTTSYTIKRGTVSGNENLAIATGVTATSYIDSGLIDGTTYYFVVQAVGPSGTSVNSPEASATPSSSAVVSGLVWTGAKSSVWDTTTTNWINGLAATTYTDSSSVTFNDSGAAAAVTISSAVTPGAITFANSNLSYSINGLPGIAGPATLYKVGTGTLTLNNTNSFSGGIVIDNGILLAGNIGANGSAWGTGPLTFLGGTLQLNGYGGNTGTGWGGMTNAMIVPAGESGTLLLPPRWGYSAPYTSPLTGGGTLNVTVDYVRDYLSGDWSGFTGQIVASPRSGTGDFRINNANGYANAAIYLNSGVNFYNVNANGQTTDIGELGGVRGAFIGAGSSSSSNPTWRIGAKNTTNTYAGTIADAGVTSLVKIGTGTLILTGTNNTYSGGTTISGGVLMAANTNGSATGSGAVTVANGGTLAGNGIISGAVTVQNGGALAPGNPLGPLTISNNLTLNSGSTIFAQVQHSPLTNDWVKVSGTLVENGTLNVTDLGIGTLASGDSFKLFSAGSFSGAFTNLVLPPLSAGLGWKTGSLNVNDTLSVVVVAKPVVGAISISVGNLVIAGTGGLANANFYLLGSTNLFLPTSNWARLLTNQFDINGDFILTNPVNAGSPQSFYQLQLP